MRYVHVPVYVHCVFSLYRRICCAFAHYIVHVHAHVHVHVYVQVHLHVYVCQYNITCYVHTVLSRLSQFFVLKFAQISLFVRCLCNYLNIEVLVVYITFI